jgi:fatty-acid desaturase
VYTDGVCSENKSVICTASVAFFCLFSPFSDVVVVVSGFRRFQSRRSYVDRKNLAFAIRFSAKQNKIAVMN